MKRIKLTRCKWLLVFGLALLVSNADALDAGFSQRMNQLVQSQFPTASFGAILIDANDGRVIYEQNSQGLFHPASNTKLFVSAAALYQLAPDYRYRTYLAAYPSAVSGNRIQGNVAIKFSGDPTLKSLDILQLFEQLRLQKIQSINGDIIIDDTEYDPPYYPNGYSIDDRPWDYAAPINSVIIDNNAVKIKIKGGALVGDSAVVNAIPPDNWVRIRNDVKTVSPETARTHCQLMGEVNSRNEVLLAGCWPIAIAEEVRGIALDNPFYRAQEVIRWALQQNQIYLGGQITRGKMPTNLKILAEHRSQPVPLLVKQLMKDSNNLYADALLKTLGKQLYQQGSFFSGVNAVNAILRKNTKINLNKIHLADGSGSRYNLISPEVISQLLYATYHSPKIKDVFLDTFPVAQVDGTLADRFQKIILPGKIIAKTGTMHDISGLSGYFWTRQGHPYIFSILINHIIEDISVAKLGEEKIVLAMLEGLQEP